MYWTNFKNYTLTPIYQYYSNNYLEKCIHRHHFVINTEKFHNLFIWFFLDINVDKGDFIFIFLGHWLQWLNLFLSVFNCDKIQKVSLGFLSKNLLSVGSGEFPNQRYAGNLNPCLNGLLEKMKHYVKQTVNSVSYLIQASSVVNISPNNGIT